MILGAVDYSLTSPCVAIYNTERKKFCFNKCNFYFLSNKKSMEEYCIYNTSNLRCALYPEWKSNEERYEKLSAWAITKLYSSEIVVFEGYSYGSKGQVFNLAENAGLLKWKLWKANKKVEIVAPTVIKKFATGKGNASKIVLEESFQKEVDIDLRKLLKQTKSQMNPSSDIIDAYYMLKYNYEKVYKPNFSPVHTNSICQKSSVTYC